MRIRRIKHIGIWISVIIIILFFLSLIYRNAILSVISIEDQSYWFLILFILSFMTDFIPQYVSAHILLINLAILDLPLIYPTVIILMGSFFGSILGFEVGRKTSPKEFKKERLKNVRTYISKYGKWFMMVAAVSPLPYFPMIFGFLKIKRIDFILFGTLPRAIGIILLSLILSSGIF